MSVVHFLKEEEIRLFWGRLTEQQQEEFIAASTAYRKAKQMVSEAIFDALEYEEGINQ